MSRDERASHQPGIVQAHQGADLDRGGEAERQHAIGADAAVAHHAELALSVAAHAQHVGEIGEAVLVQGAAGDHRRCHGKQRRQQAGQADLQRQKIDEGPDQADDGAGDRKGAGGFRDRTGRRFQRQAGEKAQRQTDLAPPLAGVPAGFAGIPLVCARRESGLVVHSLLRGPDCQEPICGCRTAAARLPV